MLKSPVLLIGYNRPHLFEANLLRILHWNPPHIYISIDGPKEFTDNSSWFELVKLLEKFKETKNITIWISKKNLGMTVNTVKSISRAISNEKSLIILEDDAEIFYNAYISICNLLNSNLAKPYSIISGFSSLPAPASLIQKLIRNKFRPATYCSIWGGWGITRDKWSLYELDISHLDINLILSKSKLWERLSPRQQNIWKSRFNKVSSDPVKTWDYQLQFIFFRYDLPGLSPIFRATDNVGFSDTRSTNTKGKKPKFYFGKTDYRQINGISNSNFTRKIMDFADSFSDLIPFLKNILKFKFFTRY